MGKSWKPGHSNDMIYSLHSRHYFAESGGDKVKCTVREASADPEKRVKHFFPESSLLTVD